MEVQRSIAVYDQKTERLRKKISLDHLKLNELKSIILPADDDPFLYVSYEIAEEMAAVWNKLLTSQVHFDFQEHSYFVECVQLPPFEFEKMKAIREIEKLLVQLGANQDAFIDTEIANLTPAVKAIPGFPEAEKVSSKTGKMRWRDWNGDILEWNMETGDLEVYSKTGKFHRGAADPATGQIRPRSADPAKTTQI